MEKERRKEGENEGKEDNNRWKLEEKKRNNDKEANK